MRPATPCDPPCDSDAFAALVRMRRDIRHFRPDPLDEADVDALLALAHGAPSVGLSQPWRYVRILSAGVRAALAAHVDDAAARAGGCYEGERRRLYDSLKLHGLREAPVVFAAYCDEDTQTGAGLGAATMAEARRYSCVMAIHTLWLAAHMRGIGLGWVSILDPDHVDRLLEVPSGWRCLGLLCLGRPAVHDDRPELEQRGWERRTDWRDHVSVR
ncbi:5,6-dimethylbenzimidazole synthase [Sphingobium aquiterrae]|uniref:5,6-dimethylbenzimidazole synthase n=1 Tax=Sphingobium aquiterrae TaxID=2038656 RepID=UPI00301B2CB2